MIEAQNLPTNLGMGIFVPLVFLILVEYALGICFVISIELESGKTNYQGHKCHDVAPMHFVLKIVVHFYHQQQVS